MHDQQEDVVLEQLKEESKEGSKEAKNILKDIKEDGNWKESINMRYGNNDFYGRRGVAGTGRGRYSENYGAGGNYRARGYDAKYRGEEVMDNTYNAHGNYSEAKEKYNASGNYVAKEETKRYLHHMLKEAEEFMYFLMENANSQEEMQMIRESIQKMSEM